MRDDRSACREGREVEDNIRRRSLAIEYLRRRTCSGFMRQEKKRNVWLESEVKEESTHRWGRNFLSSPHWPEGGDGDSQEIPKGWGGGIIPLKILECS